jgi:hypothetical protein
LLFCEIKAIFLGVYLLKTACATKCHQCVYSRSDKHRNMKYFISLFYSDLKCLNIRLFILFEHTYYIFKKLVLVKDLFQTKKRNCFLVSDFKRNRLSDILQQPTLARTTFWPQICCFLNRNEGNFS